MNLTYLNNTTTSILGYINGYTSFSNLKTINLNVSGYSNFNNDVSLISSLNVSGFTTLNNNTTILSALNVSGVSSFNSITLNKNYNDPSGNSLNFIIIHLVHFLLITVVHHILV